MFPAGFIKIGLRDPEEIWSKYESISKNAFTKKKCNFYQKSQKPKNPNHVVQKDTFSGLVLVLVIYTSQTQPSHRTNS